MGRGGWVSVLVLPACVWTATVAAGCRRPAEPPPADVVLALHLKPDPPRVGHEQVALQLFDPARRPLAAARVELQGDMNHAGMVPVLATARETALGVYVAELNLDMAGQWFITADVRLADGRRLERVLTLPAVTAGEGRP